MSRKIYHLHINFLIYSFKVSLWINKFNFYSLKQWIYQWHLYVRVLYQSINRTTIYSWDIAKYVNLKRNIKCYVISKNLNIFVFPAPAPDGRWKYCMNLKWKVRACISSLVLIDLSRAAEHCRCISRHIHSVVINTLAGFFYPRWFVLQWRVSINTTLSSRPFKQVRMRRPLFVLFTMMLYTLSVELIHRTKCLIVSTTSKCISFFVNIATHYR